MCPEPVDGPSTGSGHIANPPSGAASPISNRVRALSEEQMTAASGAPGVGPRPKPWPDDPRLDPELLSTAIIAM